MKPRRSNLSVPGHLKKMHGKANESKADVIMLDLEDSVPVGEKSSARTHVIESLLGFDWSHNTVTVRINSLDTPFAIVIYWKWLKMPVT
jgi:citrate lyase beta subunit